MNNASLRFPYVPRDATLGNASLAPMLPITLMGDRRIATSGLVDSGASVNVLPYSLGVELGFDWTKQDQTLELSGNLASVKAKIVILSAVVEKEPPVRLAFAWAETDAIWVILGQVNFFLEFNVCFFRSENTFILQRQKNTSSHLPNGYSS